MPRRHELRDRIAVILSAVETAGIRNGQEKRRVILQEFEEVHAIALDLRMTRLVRQAQAACYRYLDAPFGSADRTDEARAVVLKAVTFMAGEFDRELCDPAADGPCEPPPDVRIAAEASSVLSRALNLAEPLVVEVEHRGGTPAGELRHPVFRGVAEG